MPVSTTKKHHLEKKQTNKQTNKQTANLDIIRALGTWNPNDGILELLTVLFLMLNRFFSAVIAVIIPLPAFCSQDLIRNFRYWLRLNYFGVILGNFVLDPAINNSLIDISRYSQHSTVWNLPWSDLKVAATRLRNGSEIQRLYSGSISTRKADPTDELNPINMTIKIYRRLLKLSQFLPIRKRLVHKMRKRSVSAHL